MGGVCVCMSVCLSICVRMSVCVCEFVCINTYISSLSFMLMITQCIFSRINITL